MLQISVAAQLTAIPKKTQNITILTLKPNLLQVTTLLSKKKTILVPFLHSMALVAKFGVRPKKSHAVSNKKKPPAKHAW